MAKKAQITIEDHLQSIPATVRPIVKAALSLLRQAATDGEEVVYQTSQPSGSAMWKLARYRVNGEYVAGVGTFARHSTIYLYRGRELEDEAGLLQGGGKDTRFVTLRDQSDAADPRVAKLVARAFDLARSSS